MEACAIYLGDYYRADMTAIEVFVSVNDMEYKMLDDDNNILFRDYMIKNPDEAQKYSRLKEQILNSGVETLLEYSEKKASFILDIYEKMW